MMRRFARRLAGWRDALVALIGCAARSGTNGGGGIPTTRRICRRCRAPLDVGARMCARCGTRVR